MARGLRELWGLRESKRPENASPEREQFREAFSRKLEGVNDGSQAAAAYGTPRERQKVQTQRDALLTAYQMAANQIDPEDLPSAQQAVQRVMAAAARVEQDAAALGQRALVQCEVWRARELDLGLAEEKIAQLAEAGHAKAAALRKVAERIRTCAAKRQYGDALTGLDQLEPKLTALHREQFGGARIDLASRPARNDLSDELAAAEDFVRLWETTLENVAEQVEALRRAIAGNESPRTRSIYDGLATVMQKFPDLDLSKLVAAARANDRDAYRETLKQTAQEVQEVRDLLARGPLLSTIDENPFYKTNVHALVKQSLQVIGKALRV